MRRPASSEVDFWIRDPRGVNKLHAADRIRDNEFAKLQNWIHTNKGALYKRSGSTDDITTAQMVGASKATGIYRHYAGGLRFSIIHCRPDSTKIPQPSTDLTLDEINGGNLFDGGAVQVMRVCYTWVGMGGESNWNSNQRAGYVTGSVALPSSNPGHQTITVSSNTKGIRVTIPAFPSGIRSANIYAARGNQTQMVYMGTIYTSAGTLDLKAWIGPSAAAADTAGTLTALTGSGGSLKPGNYYVSACWFTTHDLEQGGIATAEIFPVQRNKTLVTLTNKENRINLKYNIGGGASVNGAKYACLFIGTQDPDYYPSAFVGIVKADNSESINVDSLPKSCNAQTCTLDAGGANTGRFRLSAPMGDTQNSFRSGFLLRKDSDGTLSEICFSRTELHTGSLETVNPFTNGSATTFYRPGYIYTDNDGNVGSSQPTSRSGIVEPCFTQLQGTVFFVNGENLILCTDGYCMASMHQKSGTVLPPYATQIYRFQDGLVVSGGECGSQIYGSNALQPYNWATGGTGTALRFVSIGDTFADGVTASWIYSYETADSGPKSQLIGMKKNTAWKAASIPDPNSGIPTPMDQLSGRVGTTAFRSFANTQIGCMFFASDGNFYLIRGTGEPVPVGGRVKDYFSHIPASDTLMRMMTASFHEGFYKISYPSSASSTYNDAEFYADMRTNGEDPITWSGPHTGRSVGAQHVRSGENDDMARFACRGDAAGTMKLDDSTTYQDLGSAMTSVILTKIFRHGLYRSLKRPVGVMVDAYYDEANTNNLLIEAFVDEYYLRWNKALSSGAAVFDTSTWGSGLFGGAFRRLIECFTGPEQQAVGRTLQYQITHSDNSPFIVEAIGIPFIPERRKAA